MQGSLDTYEYGNNEQGLGVYRFLVQRDPFTVWSAAKDFDKLVGILCSTKGHASRIIGNNGQVGAVYTCHYVIYRHDDHRDTTFVLKYEFNQLDEVNKKIVLTKSVTRNGYASGSSLMFISVDPHLTNPNFSVYTMETTQSVITLPIDTIKKIGMVAILPLLVGGIYLCITVGVFVTLAILSSFLFPIGGGFFVYWLYMNNSQYQMSECVSLLKAHFSSYQQQQGFTSTTPIAEAVPLDDFSQVKYVQQV
eukprot:snap_masked-scaffold_10-processed-gene-7.21-mRNA-1 protein AED:1.00 eAED:1.00 QI:0/-1/0/0/-1/1/1/0/249